MVRYRKKISLWQKVKDTLTNIINGGTSPEEGKQTAIRIIDELFRPELHRDIRFRYAATINKYLDEYKKPETPNAYTVIEKILSGDEFSFFLSRKLLDLLNYPTPNTLLFLVSYLSRFLNKKLYETYPDHFNNCIDNPMFKDIKATCDRVISAQTRSTQRTRTTNSMQTHPYPSQYPRPLLHRLQHRGPLLQHPLQHRGPLLQHPLQHRGPLLQHPLQHHGQQRVQQVQRIQGFFDRCIESNKKVSYEHKEKARNRIRSFLTGKTSYISEGEVEFFNMYLQKLLSGSYDILNTKDILDIKYFFTYGQKNTDIQVLCAYLFIDLNPDIYLLDPEIKRIIDRIIMFSSPQQRQEPFPKRRRIGEISL